MSDFDKEAEREKLREKFAKDEQKRERTSRMSELLLKGATMTNKHHDCGSPIFRWEGEEFCPTCQGTPDGEGVAQVEGEQDAAAAEAADVEVETPAERPSEEAPSPETANGTPETADRTPARAPDTAPETAADAQAPTPEPTRTPTPTGAASTAGQGGELDEARASLTRTLTSLAQQAEATSDLSKRRDLLAAVEDAAEALEATKRADR
ncbi:hypothetical protein N0B31_12790 [Salinirubellus salinus]|jgi:uncharacterized Zn finger protein (UPF0148 family)|uniref:Uncharacterized protein n=1 Tax=Salinirubellus salinus TaxID=1364945 RepID=A0A9E7U3A2_9EURY|nr:Sjogren's syndrome/scleroderma autoantigen 1 family protein [Salinirubellus salinus]UWM53025.1 hypothetical protein N0B31_12790 [Salinirubellus salinus]